MISEENKQAVVDLLIRSPKKKLVTLGRKGSNGSAQSNSSVITVRSTESTGVRQPAKSKIRRHNKRLSSVFSHSPNLRGGPHADRQLQAEDDPAELSCQVSVPGILKIFGGDICQGTNYKSVLATTQSSAKELVKEALDRYCLEKEDAGDYVLCDVIGQTGGETGGETQWRREYFRVVSDNEKPLVLQSLWKPKEGFSRRFEIQRRSSVEEQSLKERDTVTAGINAQARKLQKNRSRAISLFVDGSAEDVDGMDFWRSLSEMDLTGAAKEPGAALGEERRAEADQEVARLGVEKEETESSDDNNTQYSIHPPFDFPYFLLLHGYDHRQDFLIYLLAGGSTVLGGCRDGDGDDEESMKVDVLLYAPDVLPQHCRVRRLDADGEPGRMATVLTPFHGAPVTRNGSVLKEESELRPGDLVGLGEHYLFLFKDPTGPAGPLHTPPWVSRLCPRLDAACQSCSLPAANTDAFPPGDGEALLSYELDQEETVLQHIVDMLDPGGAAPKLTVAFLLSLCLQHSASAFHVAHFRRLLLRMAARVQHAVWDKTKELASVQTESAAEGRLLLDTRQLIPGLRPLALWMANAIELLHFVQHRVPQLMAQNRQGLGDEDVSCTRSACEDAMTVLEEVIMFTFQQSVYYLTKASWTSLRAEFGALNAAQLQHMLTHYNTGRSQPSAWSGGADQSEEAARTADILENFEQHPPLILPSRTFFLDRHDPALLQQLACLREVIGQLREIPSAPGTTCPGPVPQDPPIEATPTETQSCHGDISSCQEVLVDKLKSLEVDRQNLPTDPSCLLTPPNTPQVAQQEAELQEGSGEEEKGGEREDVFTVHVNRGPHGLGLALVDGTKTPLGMSGIYVKSLVPESPAALCRRLQTGDRILAVNGVSLRPRADSLLGGLAETPGGQDGRRQGLAGHQMLNRKSSLLPASSHVLFLFLSPTHTHTHTHMQETKSD
ncbi:ras-associating and dilute domain-containing protein-like isoform X4 [Entelurus aequoreus]|uniref:ras-associating and dilute domain-containing protein-like isoform X4 n=1 Tax=Entelurus aequoreus TaxID=161455 RepID=UPI002B1D7853|nr:ras-associating and dilute domain-containing protein-like isoform X4 [Entelurus aequoreus]